MDMFFKTFILLLLQKVSLSEEIDKRLLLNDPAIMNQRLQELETKVQQQQVQILQQQAQIQKQQLDIQQQNSSFQRQETENQLLKAMVDQHEKTFKSIEQNTRSDGVLYTRWGKHSCPPNISSAVYTGFAAGGYYSHTGSPTNYLCLPLDPIASRKKALGHANYLYGVEYETNDWKIKAADEDAPCAVCMSTLGSNKIMIPGRNECYSGWTRQYRGFLATQYYNNYGQANYVCVDEDLEFLNGGQRGTDGALFYPVTYQCGALQCPLYENDMMANCVVCTK